MKAGDVNNKIAKKDGIEESVTGGNGAPFVGNPINLGLIRSRRGD